MYCRIHYEFGFKIAELAGKKKKGVGETNIKLGIAITKLDA